MFFGSRIRRQLNKLSNQDEILITMGSRSDPNGEETTRARVIRTDSKEGIELMSGFFFTIGQLEEMKIKIDKIK